MKIPHQRAGYGICLTCAQTGAFTIATDPMHGDQCATHAAAA
jgi:hypothetical protein